MLLTIAILILTCAVYVGMGLPLSAKKVKQAILTTLDSESTIRL